MPVYIIRAGEHGPCKIGFSNNISKRLIEMQTCNHERLTILRLFEGGMAEEAQLHVRFVENWLHGEWHSYTKAMLGDVGLVEILPPVPEPAPVPAPVESPDQDQPVTGEFVEIFKELEEQWRARRKVAAE